MDGEVVRQLQVDSIDLVGGDRQVELLPGLNVVLGPIATGKSTFVKLLRALFTSIPDDLAPEVTANVTALRAACTISSHRWNILRRLVSTDTSLVEIVSEDETVLAPARKPTPSHPSTYSDWLMQTLDLPVITVPAAPTRPESDPTPVTFSDFFNYSVLRGDEIDSSVLGHTHPFRDIKRRYVFQIVYGLYDRSVAERQTELRAIELELRYLRAESAAASRIFAGTELESIEAVRVARDDRLRQAAELHESEQSLAGEARTARPADASLRLRSQEITDRLVTETSKLRTTLAQLADLEALVEQLRAQEARLTRAAVAGEALVDFEFIVCPRCGNSLDESRRSHGSCILCLQEPPPTPNPDALRMERDRIEDQIADTLELIEGRRIEVASQELAVAALEEERREVGRRLDELTATYVSDHQVQIAQAAAERSRIQAEIAKYDQYLIILERAERAAARIGELSNRADELRQALEEVTMRLRLGQANVAALEARFHEYLNRLHVPTFGLPLTAKVDSTTYLPVVSGRPFDRLSSQGLQVLVNVAHALAHHTVAIDRDLPLPGLLVIDGASSNVGTEGYDAQRLDDMYQLFAEVSGTYGDRLQIIVVDNHVPPRGHEWVRLTLTEEDRLLRISAASQNSGTTAA